MVKHFRFFLLSAALVLGAIIAPTMAQQKSTPKKAGAKPAQKAQKTPSVPAAKLTPAKPALAGKSRFLQYVPDDSIIVVAAQPGRVINAKGFQGMLDAADGKEVLKGLLDEFETNTGFRIEQIEEIGLVMDTAAVEDMTTRAKEQAERVQKLNGLKQIALAMHNFHDVNNTLPAADGYGDNKGNLSWRVHLLPYLEQGELYQQFNLDEPWDSENNKPLIKKMPDFFKTAGVDEPGKTAYHVFTGEGTPFGGEEAPGFRDYTDGTSNTLMAVLAGADTAEIWTKPGGLEIDVENPVASMGEIGDQFAAAFTDGSARLLPSKMEPSELLHLIQHQDGNVTANYYETPRTSDPLPGVIICASADFDQKAVMAKFPPRNEGEMTKIMGRDALVLPDGMFLTFVDSKTMLLGPEYTLKSMLSPQAKSGEIKAKFESMYPASDIVAVVDLGPVDEIVNEISQQMPMAPLIQSIVGATASIDAAGTADTHLSLAVQMKDKASAQQLQAIAMGGFQMARVQALGQLSSDNSPISEDVVTLLTELLDTVTIKAVEKSVELKVPRVQDAEEFLKEMTPAFTELVKGIKQSQDAVARRAKTMPLREIGLAFHNYHDIYNGFPSYCSPKLSKEDNKGLSWRVYLLPLVGEAALYEEFHLDEPWDSDHNKTLIERMPRIFACDGVEKPGYTCFHVFTGEGTPFGTEEPKRISSITDGTSNTIMVVQAGPDKADVWTKPSGIEFNAEDPISVLGNLGETFLIVLCDGSVRDVSRDIDPETLKRLIQHADGEVVGDF